MRVGDKIQCVNAIRSANMLREGQTYTVADHGPDGCIYLDDVPVLYPGFWKTRFRRLSTTDISVLTALLTPTKEREHA